MVQRAIKTTILTLTGITAAALLGLSSIGGYVNVSAIGESASLSSSGVNFEITPTSANPNGTVAIGTDELTVSSTCSSGYKLYISTTSNEESGTSLTNADNSEYSIPAVSGTIANPTLLNSSASKNHWGFAMTSSETGIADTGFSESTNTTVTNTSLFSSIPTLDNMTTIRQKTSSADNETVNVYYGVNAGTDLTPGSYSSTVMYTMVMPSPCDYTLMFEDGISEDDPVESEVTKMPESTNIGRNTEINLSSYTSEFTREGYSITGWKNLTDNLTYGANDIVNINTTNADIIKLAPIWTLNTYTITLNSGTGITNTTITVTKDTNPDATNNKTGTTTTDTNSTVIVGYQSTIQIGYTVSSGYHFNEWEITSVDTDKDGNPLITKDDLTLLSGTDATNNSIYSFTVPTSSATLIAKAEGNKYTVHFNSNGGTGGMEDVEMIYGSPSTLPENTFTAPDSAYEFYGWSTAAQEPSVDPTRGYTDGQMGIFNLTTSNTAGTGEATLYAVWKITSFGEDTMQGWTGCTSLTISTTSNYNDASTYADLRDVRNNVTYRVRRYNDDACWMAENLRLTPGSSAPTVNVDVTSGTIAANTSTSQSAGTITYTDAFSTGSYDELQAIYLYNTGYYSWEAAKVVCPAGWTLPTDTQYSTFLSKEGITNSSGVQRAPYSFILTGYYLDSSLDYYGNYAGYFSSTQNSDVDAATLIIASSYLGMRNSGKNVGYSVRCIQKIKSMQNFTAEECAGLVASTTENYNNADTFTTRVDIRNNVLYTVRKYADELCWMTENLRITPLTTDPGTSTVDSGTLTTTAANSEAAGSVVFATTLPTSGSSQNAIYLGDTEYGAYYTWNAAKLVCPTGWTLPSSAQYLTFLSSENIANSSVGAVKINGSPYNFALSGFYSDSNPILYETGDYGRYSTSTNYNSTTFPAFRFGGGSVAQVMNTYKWYGLTVRCVHISS